MVLQHFLSAGTVTSEAVVETTELLIFDGLDKVGVATRAK